MKIDLLRHGEALAVAESFSGERPLTGRGVADLERLGTRLRAAGWRPDRALSSPLLRARQSAETVLRAALHAIPIEVLPELDPARGGVEELLATLGGQDAEGHVLLIGHQPLLGELARALCGRAPGFSPATLARIECPGSPIRGAGTLVTILEP